MKVLMMLLFFVGSQMVFAQQREESSKKDFSDFPLEEPKPKRTKVLEIRYYQLSMDNHYPLDTIVVDNQKVRLFKTLQQATEYFFLVKDNNHFTKHQRIFEKRN